MHAWGAADQKSHLPSSNFIDMTQSTAASARSILHGPIFFPEEASAEYLLPAYAFLCLHRSYVHIGRKCLALTKEEKIRSYI